MPQKLSERTRLVVNRYGDGESFAKKFNPSLQVVCAQNVERSFKGNAPSLALLGETYPDEQVNTWIIAQLMDLYKFAGVKEKHHIPTGFGAFRDDTCGILLPESFLNCCFFSSS